MSHALIQRVAGALTDHLDATQGVTDDNDALGAELAPVAVAAFTADPGPATRPFARGRLPQGAVLAHLAVLWSVAETAPAGRAWLIADAALSAACTTLHALGVGTTPAAVRQAVHEVCTVYGPRPHNARAAGSPDAAGIWTARVVADLLITEVI